MATKHFDAVKHIALLIILLSSSILSFGQSTNSQTPSDTWSRFSIDAGGFITSNSSGIVLGSQNLGVGLQVDMEEALGLETSTLALRFNAKYRFSKSKRHSASFSYFDVNRSAVKVLQQDLEIGDEVFPIGTEISSDFDLTIIRAKYGYSFFHDDRISLGGSFGFYIMPISFSVKAPNFNEQSTHFTAPLPLLGLYSDFKVKNKLYFKQSVEFLYLTILNFSGQIVDVNLALEHKTFAHFGFGLGANLNNINIQVTNEDSPLNFVGKVRMGYSGLMLYGRFYF